MIQLTTLGRLTLSDGSETLLSGRRKLLALLAYLGRQSGHAVSRDRLAALFWSDVDEAHARRSLRTAITELRAAIPDVIEARDDDLRAIPGAIELDASMFESDVGRGDFEAANRRWEGDFLTGLEDLGDDEWRSWLETERARLRTQLAFALEKLCTASEAAGRWDDTVRHADRWALLLPADERAASRLVLALRAAGRESEAGARHTELSLKLEELNGAKPSMAFARLAGAPRDAAPSPGVRGLFSPDLVGRETSMGALASAWREVQRGGARCVLVEGGEGLGKTRLLEEFARQLRMETGQKTIIVARAFASEYGRLLAATRALLDQLADAPGLAAAPPEVLATLGEASPAIRERFPSAVHQPIDIGDATTRALTDVAFETPVAVILDDTPVADPASLAIIVALARRTPLRVFLLLAGETEAWNAVAAIDELRRLPHVSRITLEPLTPEESRRFVQSVAPMESEALRGLADRLHAETGGRPGMLQALVRLLVERGVLLPGPSGHWRLATALDSVVLPIPGEVGAEMRASVAALPADSRRVLESAAVVGPRVDPSLVERVSGLNVNAYRSAIADLLARRLLRISGSADGTLEFTGEAERRAAYMAIVPSSRRALHRAAARALGADMPDERHRALADEHRRLGGTDPRRRVALIAAALVGVTGLAGVSLVFGRPAVVPAGTPILLASVQNLTSDSTLGTSLDIPVRIALQQSQHITLLPVRQVSDVLVRMQKTMPPAGLDERLAQEIAVRENLPAFIHVSISAIDSTYVVTGRVIEPDQGRDLYSTSVSANGRAAILTAVDEMLKRVRTSLGESRLAVRSREQSLPRITTSSLEALRFFSAGHQEWLKLHHVAAKQLWLRAVELDTAFALALANLGDFYYVYGDAGIDRAAGSQYHDRALAHAERLSERERLALAASVAFRRDRPEEALEKYRLLAERYPDRDTWYTYGSTLMRMQQSEKAIVVLRRAVDADSMFTFGWVNLATAYQQSDKLDSSLYAYDRAAQTGEFVSLGGNVNQEWGGALLQAGRVAKAESIFTVAATKGGALDRAFGLRSLAWLGMYQGRYRSAAVRLAEAATLAETVPSALSAARNFWLQGLAELDLGETVLARRHLDRAEVVLGDLQTDPAYVFYLADLRLRTGDVAAARRLQRRIEKSARTGLPVDRGAVSLLRAQFALRDGSLDSAIAEARKVEAVALTGFRDALLSEAFDRTAQPDSAVAAARRLEAYWQFGWEAQHLWRHAPLRVAQLALKAGDSTLARAELERQVEQWKHADADFPDLVATRQLLARLTRTK